MKKMNALLIGLFTLTSLFGQAKKDVYLFSYFIKNGQDGLHLAYSYDGLKWSPLGDSSWLKPEVGNDKLMRDPCIVRGTDNRFHMVWTVSWKEKGIGYASSPDLIHWSEQKYIPVMEHEANARNTWAPEIFYDKKDKLYYIFWATTISGLYPETQSSAENAYNHRIYYTSTKDFNIFAPTKLMYELGFNVIDATIVNVGKRLVMFLKDETIDPPQKNIRWSESSSGITGFGRPSTPITGEYWAEGPTAAKVGKNWIVYFDKYRDKKMGAVSSKDLINWTDISGQVSFPKGVRHGTVLRITEKEFLQLKKNKNLDE
jgi:hypothetical protein